MNRSPWRVIVAASLFLAAPVVSCADWVNYGGNPQHTGVATESLPAPLSVVWKVSTNYLKTNTSSPIVDGGTIYFVSGDRYDTGSQLGHQRVYAVRADTGELIWKSPSGDQPATTTYRSTPAIAGDTLYVGATDGGLYALDVRNGSQKWKFVTGSPVRSHPLVYNTPDEHTVYFGSDDDFFYAIDANTGELRWKFHATADIPSAATFASDSTELIYFSSSDGHLYALNRATGRLKWSGRTNAASGDNSPVAFQNRLFLAAGNQIFSFRTRSGDVDSILPSGPEAPDNDITCTPVFADNPNGTVGQPVVYFGDYNGNFYCYTEGRRAWKQEWKKTLDAGITSMPVMSGSVVFVGANKGFVYGLNALDGSILWQYHLEAPLDLRMSYKYFNVNAPLVVSGGHLLVLADDGTLNAFGPDGVDFAGPVLTLPRPARGTQLNGLPPLTFSAYLWDTGSGINPATVHLYLDNKELEKSKEPYTRRRASSTGVVYDPVERKITYTTPRRGTGQLAAALQNGRHVLRLDAADWKGNGTSLEWSFVVDNTLPVRRPAQPGTPGAPGTPGYGAPGYGAPGYGAPGGYGNTGAYGNQGNRPLPRRPPVRGRQPGYGAPYGSPGYGYGGSRS